MSLDNPAIDEKIFDRVVTKMASADSAPSAVDSPPSPERRHTANHRVCAAQDCTHSYNQ